ncbi:MAG: TonB-dependent receptor [Opitutus sp.]|nr:TonB-dependent receptor [Opitutus sp.]
MHLVLRVILSLVVPASVAVAQTAPPSEPIVRVEKIVVEESLLAADATGTTRVHFDPTVPATTLALGALAARVANLHVNAGGAGSFGDLFTLRGLANTPYFSDPSVTVYFDDLPLGSSFTYPTGLFGFASATVYRGPQGTAFGRGGEGGTITLTSAEPGARAGGELRLSLGNSNAHFAALEAHSARGEKADATVAASAFERDGYIANTTLGTRVDDQVSSAASARVRVRPTTASEFTLQLLASRHRDGAQPLVPLAGPPFSVTRGREGSTNIDFGGVALKGAFDTTLGRLTSATSATSWKLKPYDNRLVLPPTLDSKIVQTQRGWNEEIRLASDTRADFAWKAGAWFSDGQTIGEVTRGLVLPFGVVPIEVSSYTLNARTVALFGEATFAPAAGWHLTAGLRAEETKKDFDRSQRVPGPGRITAGKTFDAFLPKLSANYALSAETTASASLSLGTKPGGWSAYTGNANLAAFKTEETTAFETGLDTSFARKTVTLAARAFVYAIRNYQIERSFNASDYLVVDAPRARAVGGELEATWRPIPEWTLTATLGVTQITLREFTDPFTKKSYAGNRAPYAPDYDAHVSATWHSPSGWFAGAEVAAIGRTFYDESENPLFASRAHAVLNARAGYDTPRWRVSLSGENLSDETYAALIIPGVRHAAPGAPRTYGFEATVKW